MSIENLSKNRSQLEELAERYVELHRNGQQPDIEDFVFRNPELADDIRELFPVMLMLDQGRESQLVSPESAMSRAADSKVAAGSRLGDYILLQPIGQGGMGVVYAAEHSKLHNRVAIKLLPQSLNRPKLRERFLREASAAARMNHPNIVRVFGFGSEDQTQYYVMSLVDGVGLDQIIASRGNSSARCESEVATRLLERYRGLADGHTQALETEAPKTEAPKTEALPTDPTAAELKSGTRLESEHTRADSTVVASLNSTVVSNSETSFSVTEHPAKSLWDWVAQIGSQAADALAYAHDMGIIHRDVKPSNLMMDAAGKLFVTDFGLAKITDDSSLTETGDLLGTLRYMPPEALEGRSDERSDIYGLGLTLYELLCGEPAYGNSDRGKLFHDITKGDCVPLRKKLPKIPSDLAQIVSKATESDPALRYASASAMRDDLRHFLAGEPITARPASVSYRTTRWIARNRVVSVLAGCLFLFLAATAATAALSARRFRDLALAKEQETKAATSSERLANLNLLRVQLSDARGWATSAQVGQRVEGLKSLQAAIGLARQLGVFDDYRDQIFEAAVTLSALHDAPVVAAWQDEKMEGSQATIGFNGDLSEYVLGDFRAGQDCQVYRVVGSANELIERIPLGQPCLGRIRFSSDGQLIGCWADVGGGNVALWVHDRKSSESYWLDEHHNNGSALGLQIRNAGRQVLYVNSHGELAIFDVDSGAQTTIDLPTSARWEKLSLSHDETRVAIYQNGARPLIVVDLHSKRIDAISHGSTGVRSLAWRPDDRHLAIGTSVIRIWDLSRRSVCTTLDQENTYVDRLNYGKDGRLLFSSGWLSRTEVHDVLAERKIFRCESIVSDVSSCGNFAAFFAGPNVRIRRIVNSDSILEFNYSRLHRQRYAGVDCATGLLWLGPNEKISVYDLSTNRSLSTRWFTREGNFVAVDPKGRDFFVSADYRLYRMPVTPLVADIGRDRRSANRIQIGPPEVLMKSDERRSLTVNNILLDSTGDRLGVDSFSSNHATVLTREQGWLPITEKESRFFPTAVAPHPSLPILVTNSHAAFGFEVYNWETDSVLLSIPQKRAFANFSPDGRRLLVQAGGRLSVFEVGSWECVATSEPRFSPGDNPPVLSSDSRWLALQTQDPRGVAILDAETLEQVLFFRGHHLDPDSFVGSFDATGRFLIANRGQKVVAAWDLHHLKRYFESLELEWPLPGLGNPTPLRDPSVEVDVLWEAEDEPEPATAEVKRKILIEIGRWGIGWLIVPYYYLQHAEDWFARSGNQRSRRLAAYVVDNVQYIEDWWLSK